MRGLLVIITVTLLCFTAVGQEAKPTPVCKDGILSQAPTMPGAQVQLCTLDLTQLQNKFLIVNNLQLQIESLQAQLKQAQAEIPKSVDTLYVKYGLDKKDYALNSQLAFEKKN